MPLRISSKPMTWMVMVLSRGKSGLAPMRYLMPLDVDHDGKVTVEEMNTGLGGAFQSGLVSK